MDFASHPIFKPCWLKGKICWGWGRGGGRKQCLWKVAAVKVSPFLCTQVVKFASQGPGSESDSLEMTGFSRVKQARKKNRSVKWPGQLYPTGTQEELLLSKAVRFLVLPDWRGFCLHCNAHKLFQEWPGSASPCHGNSDTLSQKWDSTLNKKWYRIKERGWRKRRRSSFIFRHSFTQPCSATAIL